MLELLTEISDFVYNSTCLSKWTAEFVLLYLLWCTSTTTTHIFVVL